MALSKKHPLPDIRWQGRVWKCSLCICVSVPHTEEGTGQTHSEAEHNSGHSEGELPAGKENSRRTGQVQQQVLTHRGWIWRGWTSWRCFMAFGSLDIFTPRTLYSWLWNFHLRTRTSSSPPIQSQVRGERRSMTSVSGHKETLATHSYGIFFF